MTSQFTVLNTALSSLQSHQKALDTTGHNIANADTDGYTRQRAELAATRPYSKPGRNMPTSAGQVGTGVEVQQISRLRDNFIDGQLRRQNQIGGYWNQRSEGLERLELIFNEPSENNLDQAMIDFRDGLSELSNEPESRSARTTVRERGVTLADSFNDIYRQMREYQNSLDGEVEAGVDEINSIFDRIAELNEQIIAVKGSGNQPNDLMDTRDRLLDELNELADISVSEQASGSINITMGGTQVVTGKNVKPLGVRENDDGLNEVYHQHTGERANIAGGELSGLLEIRDEEIGGLSSEGHDSGYIDELNDMARAFADHFNDVHKSGYDLNGDPGEEFFTYAADEDNPAWGLEISRNIRESTDNIAGGNYSDNPSVARVIDFDPDDIVDDSYSYRVEAGTFGEDGTSFDFEEIAAGEVKQDFQVDVNYDVDNGLDEEDVELDVWTNTATEMSAEEDIEDIAIEEDEQYEIVDLDDYFDNNETNYDNGLIDENDDEIVAVSEDREEFDLLEKAVEIDPDGELGDDHLEFEEIDDDPLSLDFDAVLTGSENDNIRAGEVHIDNISTEGDDIVEIEASGTANRLDFDVDVPEDEDIEEIEVDWEDEEVRVPEGELDELEGQDIYREVMGRMPTEEVFVDDDEETLFSVDNEFNLAVADRGEANISFDTPRGSGSNASSLARTINEDEINIGEERSSVKEYFEGVISSLGVDGQRANQMVENSEALSDQLHNQRESISGVSLDEEMANMVKYQQAYAAAANVITTFQENMNTLIGMMQ
ncbi:flagellar hook-associated protein FlgK [Halarsenatibacter silvermanii]|uniref:Flagellar hook-associated protein 1 n=1 Tax=Halarsenatibacter silvermanii TaxID=321763 RepID=A0A1G9M078_9FIRM|nr:flagellar hook-associated protein FlgK [Halarsenatibacter silvermanii]SDL67606.1 Flagella basal body rod protein [Halarsenatibacter silvermanii]